MKNNQAEAEPRVYFAALTDTAKSKQTEGEIKPKWEGGGIGWKVIQLFAVSRRELGGGEGAALHPLNSLLVTWFSTPPT